MCLLSCKQFVIILRVTRRQIEKVILTRKAQAMLGHLPDNKFKQLVNSTSVKHCKVKVNDVTNALAIVDPNLDGSEGQQLDTL